MADSQRSPQFETVAGTARSMGIDVLDLLRGHRADLVLVRLRRIPSAMFAARFSSTDAGGVLVMKV